MPPSIPPPVPVAVPPPIPPPLDGSGLASPPTPDLHLDAEHPWPGLISFSEADHDFFFGREREVAELARVIRQKTVTVFFGKSGLGKSSILRAGVSPLLRQSEFIPVCIRLNHDEAAPPLEHQVEMAIEEVLIAEKIEATKPVRAETLWEYFHKKENDWWDPDNRLVKPVLIFDQFEELLTLGQSTPERAARSAAFLTELEVLVENRPPASLAERFEAERGLARSYDLERVDYRVVLTLREDFLPDLEGLRERLRAIMFNRVRLLPMSGEQAMDVVLKPGGHLVDEDVAVRIVDFVSSSERSRPQSEVTRAQLSKRSIEPALLSVVLQELNNRRIQVGNEKITAEIVGKTNPTEIFHDFYLRGLQGMDGAVREFIEDCLLTSSGARNRIAEEDALTRRGISADIVSKLIDRRIIQREVTGNTKWLELTHDTLADIVRSDRVAHQQERQLKLAAVREAEARQKVRRVQKLALAFAGLLVVALILAGWAFREKRQAQRAQEFTMRTMDELAAGILHEIEQNPRVRIEEKLFLADRLTRSVQHLWDMGGKSEQLSTRLADLQATASLMLFDAGRVDEAAHYARQAQALIAPPSQILTNAPLVAARVQLAFALADHLSWKVNESDTLALLERTDSELRHASAGGPSDRLSAEDLKARLAWARADCLFSQSRFAAADQAAVEGISELEKTFTSSTSSTEDEPELQNIAREALQLYSLRYRIAKGSGKAQSLHDIHAKFDKTLQEARLRFPNRADDLWKYFGAKNDQLAATIAERDASYDEAFTQAGRAVGEFYQLLVDDPQNLQWRYDLGVALCQRAEIATFAGQSEGDQSPDRDAAQKLAKMDRETARKLAITIQRDQRNRSLSFLLACLSYSENDPVEAASFLGRVSFEEQRFGPRQDFQRMSIFAHTDCLKVNLQKELYPAAIHDAEAALATIDQLKFTDKEAAQRCAWRLDILEVILRVAADKLGRDRWLRFYAQAQADLNSLLQASKPPGEISSACYIVLLLRGDQYMRDRQYHDAIAAFIQASNYALAAIKGEKDQLVDLQNYLYSQGNLLESHAQFGDWGAALSVCRDTRAQVSDNVKTQPKLVAVYRYLEWMASLIDKARKLVEERPPAPSNEATEVTQKLTSEYNAVTEQAEEFKRRQAEEVKRVANAAPSAPRIDLLHFSLSDFQDEKKNSYYLVKQRLGWIDAPIYSAPWRTLAGKEFDDLASLVAEKKGIAERQIQRIRACPLNFYEQGKLVEAEYIDAKGDLYTTAILAGKGAAYRLDGTSPPIHKANASIPLNLKNAEDVAAYLRFFCSYVRDVGGGKGAFQIVENTGDLPWATSAPSELKNDVGRLLRPFVVWPDPPDGHGSWRAKATVQFSNAIFLAEFKIQNGGMVEMLDDKPVAANMPFYLPVYKNGDRGAGKVEALKLALVAPPEGDDEVDCFLAMAKTEKQPDIRAELADEAGALQFAISTTFEKTEKLASDLEKVLLQASRYDLLDRNFAGALVWAEKGLKMAEGSLPLEANRAHALLFLGRTAEADGIYRKYIGQKIEPDSQKTWEQVILDDFDQLQKDGITNPNFDRIRGILKTGGSKH